MIDWLTISVDLRHKPLPSGRITSIHPDGTIEYDIPKSLKASGSWDSSTQVRSRGFLADGLATKLELHGNPSKFLQGHNAFGSDDIGYLASLWVQAVCSEFEIDIDPLQLKRIERGFFSVTRIDINYMYRVMDSADANTFLQTLAETSGTKYQKALYQKGSVYFNKTSRRFSFVFYRKDEELSVRRKANRLNFDDETNQMLKDYCKNTVRAECRLLSLELKDKGFKTGRDIQDYGVSRIYKEYMSKIQVTGNMKITSKEELNMPNRLRGTYQLWLSGYDVRNSMSDASYFRHKKELKEGYGIDISQQRRPATSNIVSLSRVLELDPLPAPQFLYDKGLIVFKRAV